MWRLRRAYRRALLTELSREEDRLLDNMQKSHEAGLKAQLSELPVPCVEGHLCKKCWFKPSRFECPNVRKQFRARLYQAEVLAKREYKKTDPQYLSSLNYVHRARKLVKSIHMARDQDAFLRSLGSGRWLDPTSNRFYIPRLCPEIPKTKTPGSV